MSTGYINADKTTKFPCTWHWFEGIAATILVEVGVVVHDGVCLLQGSGLKI